MKILASIFLVIISFSIPKTAFSQAAKGEVKGKVLEESSKKSLPYATIAIYTAQDTSLVTFRVSDEKGLFKVTALPLQVKLRVLVSMTGFSVYRKEFTLTPGAASMDLGEITMQLSANLLKEVLIQAEIPPVIVRQDTLEFNTASFKTLPTALLEDLLKKLPGVTVDNSGKITVNGKQVNRILVEGREFFGNDPLVATRNLPADIIDKVQVMNDPEAVQQNPFMPENQIPQVINLKFKKGIKKGAFGKVYAGAGTQQRYEAGGILNLFRDTTQVSLIGYSNNLTRAGFGGSDLSRLGGFNRTGLTSIMQTETGLELNDISFGGTGEGIQQSSGGGANFNTLYRDKVKLNLLYFYGDIHSHLNQLTNSVQALDAYSIDTRRTRDQASSMYNHRLGGMLEWKPDPATTFIVRPSIGLNMGYASQKLFTHTRRNKSEPLNEGSNAERVNSHANSYAATISLSKNFKKKGRRLYLNGHYSLGDGLNEQYNEAVNAFYQPQAYTTDLNQLRQRSQSGVEIRNRAIYTEPLAKDLEATLRLESEYSDHDNVVNTFNNHASGEAYSVPVPDLSDFLRRQTWKNSLYPGLRWSSSKRKIYINTSLSLQSLQYRNRYQESPDISQKYLFLFPTFYFVWRNMSVNYQTVVQEPNALDLQPVSNNSNPLFIQAGNPELKPANTNYLSFRFNKYDMKRLLRTNFSVSNIDYDNYVIRERTLSPEGIQTTRPVNVDGVRRVISEAGLTKDFKFSGKNQFSVGSSLSLSYDKSLFLLNALDSDARIWNLNPSVEGRINLADKLEISQRFTFGQQRSYYGSGLFDNRFIMNRAWNANIIVRMPQKLVWNAGVDYRYNSNAAPGIRPQITRLNAGITYLFLKKDQGQLKLTAFDLLNQNVNITRTIRENMTEDVQTRALTRYVMLTFNYNIRSFGGRAGAKGPLKF